MIAQYSVKHTYIGTFEDGFSADTTKHPRDVLKWSERPSLERGVQDVPNATSLFHKMCLIGCSLEVLKSAFKFMQKTSCKS